MPLLLVAKATGRRCCVCRVGKQPSVPTTRRHSKSHLININTNVNSNFRQTKKMKIFFTQCLTIIVSFSFAQFAIVYDKDSFCNVRSFAGKDNNIIDKLKNGYIVYCFQNETNWTDIDYSKNGKALNGQVYKDRVIFISSYLTVPVLTKNNAKIILKKDSIKIVLTEQKFDKSKHRFSFYKEAKTQIELVDNKKYWGKDGGVPASEYKSIEVTIGQRKILLPKKAFENLYEPSLYNTQVNYDKTNDIIYIQSMNSDGAGSYEVIWKIDKGVYKDRFIAYGF